jgi:hypothetical protein
MTNSSIITNAYTYHTKDGYYIESNVQLKPGSFITFARNTYIPEFQRVVEVIDIPFCTTISIKTVNVEMPHLIPVRRYKKSY